MPFGNFKDFDSCVAANSDKSNPKAYCGSIKNKVEGAKIAKQRLARIKLQMRMSRLKKAQFTSQDPGSPDFHHYKTKKIKRKNYPSNYPPKGAMLKLASNSGGKYAKYYLIDGLDINGNGWGITPESVPNNIESFIGMPFVITAKEWIPNSEYEDQYDHPFIPTNNMDMILNHQAKFRVGDIVKVAKDEDERWYAMIAIDEKFRDRSLPPFCSPAIYQLNPHESEGNITQWTGLHLAGLDRDPAYGPRVAILKGSCTGDPKSCAHQFRMAKIQKAQDEIKPIDQKGQSGISETETDKEPGMCECENKTKELKSRLAKVKQSIKKRKKNGY